MTFYENIPSLEVRALAMPHMRDMLKALVAKERSLITHMGSEVLWRKTIGISARGSVGQKSHISAAREAGFITVELVGSSIRTKISLTDKGRAVIGAPEPMWRVAS